MGMPLSDDQLKAQWHSTLNLPVTFDTIKVVTKKYWWVGTCEHPFEASLRDRKIGYGCTYCASKKILVGFNDFESQNPIVVKEWHPTRNLPVLPSQVFKGYSRGKYWWLCSKGHEYEMKPLHRAHGHGCGYCSGYHPIVGENDLATTHPKLVAKYWNYAKNESLLPTHVKAGSKTSAWWLCSEGHDTYGPVADKVDKNVNCKYCSNQALQLHYNDLVTENPELAKQWHPTKNGTEKPEDYTAGSKHVVWWLCEDGHDWERDIGARNSGAGCPFCSGNRVWVGFNDLATVNPKLAAEWHPTLNGSRTPQNFTGTSGESVHWLGGCGHAWEALISNRKNGAGCNPCGIIQQGITHSTPKEGKDLLSVNPAMARQWHPTKNGDLRPEHVRAGAAKSIWWICEEKGHEWFVSIATRVHYNTGCPDCAKHRHVSIPEQEIADFIDSLGIKAEQSNRKLLGKNRELDLYMQELNFALEFNGLHWHSEAKKVKSYHYDKWLDCKAAGVELMQVWEDDWRLHKDLIMLSLARKLNVLDNFYSIFPELEPVAPVGKINVVLLDSLDSNIFLTQHHLLGVYASAIASTSFGVMDEAGVIHAVMTITVQNNIITIHRFADNGSRDIEKYLVLILSHITSVLSPEAIAVKIDHCVNNQELFEAVGFIELEELPLSCMFRVQDSRINDAELLLLGDSVKSSRIWDVGSTLYILNLK